MEAGLPDLTPDELRHTCASIAISQGANVLAVSRMLGHKDTSITLRIYGHLFESDLDAVAERLDASVSDLQKMVKKADVIDLPIAQ